MLPSMVGHVSCAIDSGRSHRPGSSQHRRKTRRGIRERLDNPFERRDRYSAFLRACAWGDAREVEAMLALATDAEAREKLLETRESNLRFNALRACITGARNKPGTVSPADARCGGWPLDGAARSRLEREPPNHPRVAELLLAAGARLAQLPAARNVVYAVLGNVVDSAGGALLGVAATTFALKAAAGSQRRGAVYGAYLAAYDSGGAAGGWLAVFLASQCRTAPEDPASVRRYLYVASSFALLPLAFLPLVPGPEPPREESSDDESSDDDVSLVL